MLDDTQARRRVVQRLGDFLTDARDRFKLRFFRLGEVVLDFRSRQIRRELGSAGGFAPLVVDRLTRLGRQRQRAPFDEQLALAGGARQLLRGGAEMLPPQPRQFLLQRFDARPRLGAQLRESTRKVLLLLENDSFERIDIIGK